MKKIYSLLVVFFLGFSLNGQIINIPDANFKAKLLLASSSNGIASSESPIIYENQYVLPSYCSIDVNDDGEIQVTEAQAIKWLNVTNIGTNPFFPSTPLLSDVTGIEFFSNLEYFWCQSNQINNLNLSSLFNLKVVHCFSNSLTSINISGLVNLEDLDVSNNLLTNINLDGLINLKKFSCELNQFNQLNLSNLTNLKILYCRYNQISVINFDDHANLESIACDYNQLVNLEIIDLPNLKTLACSNNLLQNISFINANNIETLSIYDNQLSSIALNSLLHLKGLFCGNNQLAELSLTNNVELFQLQCDNNQLINLDLSSNPLIELICNNNQLMSLYIKNDNFESIYFSNNPNLQYICADENQINDIQYLINEYGIASTCHVNSYCNFTPGGTFYTIQGNNKFDEDNNGCNAMDLIYPNLKFDITEGTVSGSLISNSAGNYSIPVQAGTHTITPQIENPTYFVASPTSATVSFPTSVSPFVQNFCITPVGVHHDLEVVLIPIIGSRPGFDATYKIKYKNKGNLNENATVSFNYNDTILDYVSESVSPTVQTIGTISWNVGTLEPFQTGEILVTLNVNSPMEIPAINEGDVINYTATITGLIADETPEDNTFLLNETVVNSFDPNDKTCLEGNTITPTMVGKYLHYKIRFENTGTANAQNIVVKDMIDTTKFDITTIQMTDTSHNCVTRITGTNKVEFIFENIQLPFDDANNDGYVVLKIKTLPTLVLGNTFSNSASIYFDYNFPIVTNTAITSIANALKNQDFVFENYFSISPVPSKEVLNITSKQNIQISAINIYNILGQLVLVFPNTKGLNTIDVSSLKTGNYFIKINSDKGVSNSKFIKE